VDNDIVTEWNQAEAYQYRIHQLLTSAHRASIEEDYRGWFRCICGFYRELSSVIDDKEKEEDIKKMIRNARNTMITTENSEELFDTFTELESQLRKMMKNFGLLVPPADDKTKMLRGVND
jgi:hypothetical protein